MGCCCCGRSLPWPSNPWSWIRSCIQCVIYAKTAYGSVSSLVGYISSAQYIMGGIYVQCIINEIAAYQRYTIASVYTIDSRSSVYRRQYTSESISSVQYINILWWYIPSMAYISLPFYIWYTSTVAHHRQHVITIDGVSSQWYTLSLISIIISVILIRGISWNNYIGLIIEGSV